MNKMDSNDPGVSLFQGNELSNFNNFEQREEEEEALEEQRRRDLELKNELENAFDDVSFDEESICNGNDIRSSSPNSSRQSSLLHKVESCFLKETSQKISVLDNNIPSVLPGNFNTSLKQLVKRNLIQKVDCCTDQGNFPEDCGKKLINGNLHDVVDQSGGGEQNLQSLMHYNHCFQKNSLEENICSVLPNNTNNILMPNFTDQAEDSSEQLKILYDIRVREVHRLTELIDSIRNEHEIKINDLKHQLALAVAEKERANLSHTQLQSLLMDCKQQVEKLLNDVNTLEKVKKELETTNKELLFEFETSKLTIDDLQRKILVLEKGSKNKTEAEQYELNIKGLTEKHNSELMSMKKELDSYMRNYETLLRENEELKLKIINLSQINDENLTKKSEIISRLSQQIEETQMKCENLMKLSTAEDNYRLQAELKIIKEEKLQLMAKIEGLEKEKARQEEELQQYESLNKICFFNSSNCSDFKDSEGLEFNGKLGAELYRAISSQKAKRLEIKNLQTQLNEKNEQVLLLMENEKAFSKEIEKLKGEAQINVSKLIEKENLICQKEKECMTLQASVRELEEKVSFYQSEYQSKFEQLEEENKTLKAKVTDLERDAVEMMSNYNKEYLRFHNEGLEKMREETEKYFKLEILQKDLENENLKKEIEELKILYVEVCNAKENLLSQREKEKNVPLSAGVDLEEVKRLQKELEKSRHRILELDHTLKQQYEQEVEVLNSDLNQLKLQLERLKKEKDREISEKDKTLAENKLLKTEIEQITSEKNLLFLDYEKLMKEADNLRDEVEKIKENSNTEVKKIKEKHSLTLQNLINKYEITIKKLKKEIELSVKEVVKCESKYTSPIKNCMKNVGTQEHSLVLVDKCTSPISKLLIAENRVSAIASKEPSCLYKDISILTDPEPVKIPKKEVIEIMEKFGAHHEQEIVQLEKKHTAELLKLEKKFHVELDSAKEMIQQQLKKKHLLELEKLKEKHKIEMENRIEQEKHEAIVELITEWACEVQSLKVLYAESQAEKEKMKLKCKAATNMALQYKAYFKDQTDHMKEEWKKIEDSYVQTLQSLEKNIQAFVNTKEDVFEAKVDSITQQYEQQIIKMKEKLLHCEKKLKAEKKSESKKLESAFPQVKVEFKKELASLSTPDRTLWRKVSLSPKGKPEDVLSQFRRLLKTNDDEESGVCLKLNCDKSNISRTPKKNRQFRSEMENKKEKTDR